MAGIPGMGTPRSLMKEEDGLPQIKDIGMINIPAKKEVSAVEDTSDMDADFAAAGGVLTLDEMASMDADFEASMGETPAVAEPVVDSFAGGVAGDFALNNPEVPAEETIDISQQIRQIPTRAKASFAKTDQGVQNVLEEAYGKENVRKDGKKLQYKYDGKWKTWDAGTELVGDVVDFTRDVVAEVPAALGGLAGAALGGGSAILSGVGIPATPAAVAGGLAAGRAAGTLAGEFIADTIAEQFLNIKDDPKERNKFIEYGLATVAAPLFGAASDWASSQLAKRAAKKTADRSKLLPANELFKNEIDNIKSATDEIKKFGVDSPLLLSQRNPGNQLAREVSQAASGLPQYKQVIELQAQNFDDGLDSFLKMIGQATDNAGQKFKNLSLAVADEEGKLIGSIRKDLVKESGNAELPVPNLLNKLDNFRNSLGFTKDADGNFLPSSVVAKQMADNGFDRSGAKVIARKAEKIFEEITNKEGRLTAPELFGFYEELNGLYKNIAGSGLTKNNVYQNKVGELRNIISSELKDKINVISGGDVNKQYLKSLARYTELAKASDELSSVLGPDNINSTALAKAVFDKGKDGLDKLEAVKAITRNNPELYGNVINSYFDSIKLIPGVVNPSNGRLNADKFLKEINKLGPEMLESAFGKDHKKTLEAFGVVADAMSRGTIPPSGTPQRVNFLKNLVIAFSTGSPFAAGSSSEQALKGMDIDNALLATINEEGIQKFLSTAPKEQKAFLSNVLERFQDSSLKAIKKAPPVGRQIMREGNEDKQ